MPVFSQTTQKKKFSSKLILRTFIYANRVGKHFCFTQEYFLSVPSKKNKSLRLLAFYSHCFYLNKKNKIAYSLSELVTSLDIQNSNFEVPSFFLCKTLIFPDSLS